MKKLLILILTLTVTNAHAWGYNAEKEARKNLKRTDAQVCEKLRGYMQWSNTDAAEDMRLELVAREAFSPRELKGLIWGYKINGFVGFSKKAMECRFILNREYSSRSRGWIYEHYSTLDHWAGFKTVIFVNGKVHTTQEF